MLETGFPRDDEREEACSVLPLTPCPTSQSSSPGISFFDGTPLHLLPVSLPPTPSSADASSRDMAVETAGYSAFGHHHQPSIKVREMSKETRRTESINRHCIPPVDRPLHWTREQQPGSALSLQELSTLAARQVYVAGRCCRTQSDLYHANINAARTARLGMVARSIQRTLAECIRSEDKQSFANLFNAFCDALSEPSSPPCECERLDRPGSGRLAGSPPTFLDVLPAKSRLSILSFLSRIRLDPAFLAARLATLTHKELLSLLPEKGLSRSDESILGSSHRTPSRNSRNLGYVVDGQTELLSSYDMASPLEVLIHAVRRWPTHNSQADDTARDVWATVCSKLITEQRPGSEKLVPAVIESWACSSPWPGKERLELWLMHTLQQGSFLLDQAHKQTFSLRVQARAAPAPEEGIRREQFYTDAVESLLRLLASPEGASIIPPGAMELCRAIHTKLEYSPAHQRAFPNFAITRWLFSSFLLDAIILPEAHGLLTDYFISERARQRILREVAGRCSKAVFDAVYSWKLGHVPSEQEADLVRALAKRFETLENGGQDLSREPAVKHDECAFVALSVSDVSTLVNALYPAQHLPALGDRDSLHSGLRSSASSISGFSLFQPVAHTNSAFGDLSGSSQDVGPSGDSGSSGTPHGFAGVTIGSVDTTAADFDGEQLREVCVELDDHLARRRCTARDHWSVLVDNGKADGLCTIHDRLSRLAVSPTSSPSGHPPSTMQESCRKTIDHLLDHGLLSQERRLAFSDPEENAASVRTAIIRVLERQIDVHADRMELVQARLCTDELRQIRDITSGPSCAHPLLSILEQSRTDRQESLGVSQAILRYCDDLLRCTSPWLDRQSTYLRGSFRTMRRLRNKMWYTADVRTSAIYEDAHAVASAIRAMGRAQTPPRTSLAPSSRPSTGSKGAFTNFHAKTETQILDILTAPPAYGGRIKFGDDQSRSLAVWMERNAIENLCRGEERIHKVCMEIKKVVDNVTSENSPLMASDLLSRDTPFPANGRPGQAFPTLRENGGRIQPLSLRTDVPPSIDARSNASSQALSARSSRDRLDSWSPSATNRSSASVWSPLMTEARSPSSITSVGTSHTRNAALFAARSGSSASRADSYDPIDALPHHTTSLLISDLANGIFRDGSETDLAFWTGFGGELAERYLRTFVLRSTREQTVPAPMSSFALADAFPKLISRFSASSNPYFKLKVLLDIDRLLEPASSGSRPAGTAASSTRKVDVKVEAFRRLFCEKATRPHAIFRDLQYIAALVPYETLETTPEGKAFWNAAVAISGLRRGLITIMVETADSIIAYHSNKRGHGRSSSMAQQERDSAAFAVANRSPSPEDVSGRSMADAAWLLQITAKEGDAVAQRELATLYLTHPELMDHVIAPLSRPREVFREELESKWRKNQDPTRCDPTTMCVAHHWMMLSSKGGDALAREFLKQREEMERLP